MVTGRREMAAALAPALKIGENINDGVFLPVTIRGEMPGRAMRGGADYLVKMTEGASV
jgi:hypothetical protein